MQAGALPDQCEACASANAAGLSTRTAVTTTTKNRAIMRPSFSRPGGFSHGRTSAAVRGRTKCSKPLNDVKRAFHTWG